MMQFKTGNLQDMAGLRERAQILLVTATKVETNALHARFRPLHPRTRCLKITVDNQTYYIGRLGVYGVIHVQCQMGSVLPGASESTVAAAITQWGVKAVVMVGIAFGVDRKKQRVGDVLVSKTIIPYEIKRVGKEKVIPRGPIPPCGSTLLNRFTNGLRWAYSLERNQKARLIPADLLSGESLIDNAAHRTKLLEMFQQAAGGEMEGTGVFAAAHPKSIEWILVKGICDFADGKKSRGKKKNQLTAASSATSLCEHVLSQPGSFDGLGCFDLSARRSQTAVGRMNFEQVLFEVYDKPHERAYLARTVDDDINAVLGHQGIWISGPSGCGKTNALRRNLSINGKTFEFIDLSRCVGNSVPELFDTLQMEIAERLGVGRSERTVTCAGNNLSFHIGQVASLLAENVKHETHIIIDEIPLDGANFCEFADGIAAVIIMLGNQNSHKTAFYLATIIDPEHALKIVRSKLRARMRLLKMPVWSEADLTSLLRKIASLCPLHLSAAQKVRIVKAANGSPRDLKVMLKTWVMYRNTPGWSLERVLTECPGQPS